ncbi:hypothetical protein C8F04DRAFT_1277779 [Mycena alexandri]|uniref:Uncharacterized protein n=1 Tax=Mycena alexandri TaxID=1745969 RepID=A0AAD6RZS0_9AGAR|nr:hypothetical protein C8F04DRAFT_1277779 [Mycena alexandri]
MANIPELPSLTMFHPSVSFAVVILETTFFQDKFGVALGGFPALIFVTRSHGFFFMERPSTALIGAFCGAQLISSIIAAFANLGFTNIHSISGGWIGIT